MGQTVGQAGGEALRRHAAGDGKGGGANGQPPSPAGLDEAAEEEGALPPLEVGQIVHVSRLEVVEKETQPPRPYDDASLLAAMKNAGREIEDDALAAAMKESGLGTPATRAEIIEKLIRTGYVERQRKQLRATPKGQALIGLVAEPLRSPELTAQWEQRLKDIERGQAAAEDFYRDIVAWVRGLIPTLGQGEALSRLPEVGARPSAGQGAKQRPKRWDSGQVEQQAGQMAPRQGGRQAGQRVRHQVVVNPSRRDAADRTGGLGPLTCPKCGRGQIIVGRRGYGCDRYREGCDFVVWKEVAGCELTVGQIGELIATGRTGLIRGFTAASGVQLDARLRLDEQWRVVLDFA